MIVIDIWTTIWAAGLERGQRTYRAYSEDRADERDRALLDVWSVTLRELLAHLPGDAHPTIAEWDAMSPTARVAACKNAWFDFSNFTFLVQQTDITDTLRDAQRH